MSWAAAGCGLVRLGYRWTRRTGPVPDAGGTARGASIGASIHADGRRHGVVSLLVVPACRRLTAPIRAAVPFVPACRARRLRRGGGAERASGGGRCAGARRRLCQARAPREECALAPQERSGATDGRCRILRGKCPPPSHLE